MREEDMGLGDLAKQWAKSKATEMLSSDSQKAASASADADATEREAKDQAGEQLVRTAFPGLAKWKDKQEESQRQAEEDRLQRLRDEIAALPVAQVQMRVTGWAEDAWFGPMHLRWEVVTPDGPDPEYTDPDPYAYRPYLSVELHPQAGNAVSLGSHRLASWRFQVPGYTGDGSYDLLAISREREAAGAALAYDEAYLELDEDTDYFYCYTDSGPWSVTVSEGGRRMAVSMVLTSSIGDMTMTADITREHGS
ncbi:hypothetical protein SFC88_17915 [Nocardioides sp. HM23]|uniref:hypothetical protein n=1 Tax=Nocardioides bizhenqiangii TaxID=3095076 RepID=UPI002ACA5764|nr:hypothetical protein [Nocardioides sp. HM23]MDZ5622723.1 hypothetical protein [Nocardioides sp. HM23]